MKSKAARLTQHILIILILSRMHNDERLPHFDVVY